MKKKWIGTLALLSAAYLGTKKYQASKENQSLRSKLFEEGAGRFPLFPDARDGKVFRKLLKASEKPFHLPPFARRVYGVSEAQGYESVYEILPERTKPEQTIFYLHGGAYWFGPFYPHFATLRKIANQTNSRVIMPIYPKAPAYTVDEVFSFVNQAYRQLLVEMSDSQLPIIFMGDSAGGGLALAFAQKLLSEERKLPSKIILLSPWLDVSNQNPDMAKFQRVDTLLNQEKLAFYGELYAGLHSVNDPMVSPIRGEFIGLPPIFMFTGGHDSLSVDVLDLQERADENDWAIQTFYFDNRMHTFMLFPSPEAKEALDLVNKVIKTKEFD